MEEEREEGDGGVSVIGHGNSRSTTYECYDMYDSEMIVRAGRAVWTEGSPQRPEVVGDNNMIMQGKVCQPDCRMPMLGSCKPLHVAWYIISISTVSLEYLLWHLKPMTESSVAFSVETHEVTFIPLVISHHMKHMSEWGVPWVLLPIVNFFSMCLAQPFLEPPPSKVFSMLEAR